MLSREEQVVYEHILGEMARHVHQFITPISKILSQDRGRAAGSGTYVLINGAIYLLTNEHVAKEMLENGIAHLPRHDDNYRRLVQPMAVLDFPIDVGLARIDSASWGGATQKSLSVDRFDDKYCPVDGEVLFICGYPGYARRAVAEGEIRQPRETQFDWLSIPAVPILTYPVNDPERFPWSLDRRYHVVVNYEGLAHRSGKGLHETPDPMGFSGSLLWDTKFFACGGDNWTPSMARVCGQIQRWDDERGLLAATRVEWLREAMLSAVRHEAAFFNWIRRGRPLWENLVDWTWAEQSVPRLSS